MKWIKLSKEAGDPEQTKENLVSLSHLCNFTLNKVAASVVNGKPKGFSWQLIGWAPNDDHYLLYKGDEVTARKIYSHLVQWLRTDDYTLFDVDAWIEAEESDNE